MALMTKSQQVERKIRKQINSGKFLPGQQLPTDREMTSKFGVSLMTVREALIKLSKDGLIERKQGSGTYVSQTVKKATIGILANVNHITSSNSYFYRDIIEIAKKHIKAAGLQPVLFVAHNQTSETTPSDIHLFDKGVIEQMAGVISLINLSKIEDKLQEQGIPAVSMPHCFSKYAVVHDYEAMTRKGVEILRDCGYSDITLMHFDYSQVHYDDEIHSRIATVLQELKTDGVKLAGVSFTESCEHAYDVFKDLWGSSQRPRAIFFHDDAICDVATRAILELGIKVPDELAILTMSNIGRKFVFPVPLTSVCFDTNVSMEMTWTMLSKLIDGKKVEPPVEPVPPCIQKGASLG